MVKRKRRKAKSVWTRDLWDNPHILNHWDYVDWKEKGKQKTNGLPKIKGRIKIIQLR